LTKKLIKTESRQQNSLPNFIPVGFKINRFHKMMAHSSKSFIS
jgi:hypothetical protein